VRRAGVGSGAPKGPGVDPPVPGPVLELVGEEPLAAAGLRPLHGERHPRPYAVEEGQGVGGGPARVEAEGPPARAGVDGGVLVEAGRDLAGVHLHAVARHRAAGAPGALPLEAGPLQPVLAVAGQDLVDGGERQPQPVPADELVPGHLGRELALAARAEAQRLLLGEGLAVRRAVRSTASRLEADGTFGPIAAPPLAERRAGDAASPADEAGDAGLRSQSLTQPAPQALAPSPQERASGDARGPSRARVHGPSAPAGPAVGLLGDAAPRVAPNPTAAAAPQPRRDRVRLQPAEAGPARWNRPREHQMKR
jgi:hypothetical protein